MKDRSNLQASLGTSEVYLTKKLQNLILSTIAKVYP